MGVTASLAYNGYGRWDDTPARELLDGKGPSGATAVAHTPRIPKGRAKASLSFRLRTSMRGRTREDKPGGAGLSQSQPPTRAREREVGAAAKGEHPLLTDFLRRVPGTPTVGDGVLFAEAQPLKV